MFDKFSLPYPYDHVIFDLFISSAFVKYAVRFLYQESLLPMHVELVVILVYSIKVYV